MYLNSRRLFTERALYLPAWPGFSPIQAIPSNFFAPQQTLPKESSPSKTSPHAATLIFLHGVGGNGDDLVSTISAVVEPHVKVVTPTAPKIPVTVKSGEVLNAWFDIKSNESTTDEDEKRIKESRDAIVKVIEQEIASGIPSSRIVIAGFSQGGALALYAGLTSQYKLGGILALSAWLPLAKDFPAAAANNLDVPIFQVIIKFLFSLHQMNWIVILQKNVDTKNQTFLFEVRKTCYTVLPTLPHIIKPTL